RDAGVNTIDGERRKSIERVVVIVEGQPDLLQIVLALGAAGRLPRLLHGRQQERDEHADDGDHDQKLNQCEPSIFRFHVGLLKKMAEKATATAGLRFRKKWRQVMLL